MTIFTLLDFERIISGLRRRIRLLEIQGNTSIIKTGLAVDRPTQLDLSPGTTVMYYAYNTKILSVWNINNQEWDIIATLNADLNFNINNTSFTVNQTGHGFIVGNIVRNSGDENTFIKAKADSEENAEVAGYVSAVINPNSFTLTTHGLITTGIPNAIAGSVLFLSPTIAGEFTTIEPTADGEISKPLAIVLESSAKIIFINFRGEKINLI